MPTNYHTRFKETKITNRADPDDVIEVSIIFKIDNAQQKVIEDFVNSNKLIFVYSEGSLCKIKGRIKDFEKLFNIKIFNYIDNNKCYRCYQGLIKFPSCLEDIITGVVGLDTFYHHPVDQVSALNPEQKKGYFPNEIAQIYNFPKDADGSGECIGIIELGGGYDKVTLEKYFKEKLKIKCPSVSHVGCNNPRGNHSGEVMMDIQIAGAVAPGADIVVYFPEKDSSHFIETFSRAINDNENNPSVISISWGAHETWYSKDEINSFNQLLKEAAMKGITVCASSGDYGASLGVNSFDKFHNPNNSAALVQYPASDPGVLSCGGTTLIDDNGKIKEAIWNNLSTLLMVKGDKGEMEFVGNGGSSGGGISILHKQPDYQKSSELSDYLFSKDFITIENNKIHKSSFLGRGVPDVSANADGNTGYKVLHNFSTELAVVGGTSAVSPLWAGLIAILNEKLGRRLGFINPVLYKLHVENDPGIFNSIIPGTNGAYSMSAHDKWNPCTGLGSPDGMKLYTALEKYFKSSS